MADYFLGDVPITCPASHSWPTHLDQVANTHDQSIRVNDVFQINMPIHNIKLVIAVPSLIRIYLTPFSG